LCNEGVILATNGLKLNSPDNVCVQNKTTFHRNRLSSFGHETSRRTDKTQHYAWNENKMMLRLESRTPITLNEN
jgi:hypothetical protein